MSSSLQAGPGRAGEAHTGSLHHNLEDWRSISHLRICCGHITDAWRGVRRTTGASRAAVIFSGRSGGAITGVTCTSVPYGIVVADTAAPTLGESSCQVARGG